MIKDILNEVYDRLMSNEQISEIGKTQIKFYDITENVDKSKPFIIITPLKNNPSTYASDKHNNFYFAIQIDVQSTERLMCKKLQHAIRKTMKEFGFNQADDTLDEFFKETGRYVDARRYEGSSKIYDTNY